MRERIPTPPNPELLSNGIKNGCDVWRFWSHKGGDRVVTLYSPWEFENAKRLEEDRNVICWREQPLRVKRARANGKDYILDFWAYLIDRTEEWGEVKPKSYLIETPAGEWIPADWPNVVRHIESINGIPRVVTDEELKDDAFLLANWEHAIGHIARAYYYDDTRLRQRISDLVTSRPPITLGEIEGHLSSSFCCDVWAQTLRLYQEGVITADLRNEHLDRCLKFRPMVD